MRLLHKLDNRLKIPKRKFHKTSRTFLIIRIEKQKSILEEAEIRKKNTERVSE